MANIEKTYAIRDNGTTLVSVAGTAEQTVPCDTQDEKTGIIVENTSSTEEAVVTICAGNGMRKSIGDLVVTVPVSSEYLIGPLDSMRFKDLETGSITVKISGGTTTVKAFSL